MLRELRARWAPHASLVGLAGGLLVSLAACSGAAPPPGGAEAPPGPTAPGTSAPPSEATPDGPTFHGLRWTFDAAGVDPEAAAALVGKRLEATVGSGLHAYAQAGKVIVDIPRVEAEPELVETARDALRMRGHFEVRRVDDDSRFFADVRDKGAAPLGIEMESELFSSPAGPVHELVFAVASRQPDEDLAGTRTRLETWTRGLSVPTGLEIALQPRFEHDPVEDAEVQSGWRTLLVRREVELDNADVAKATVELDPPETWLLQLELTPAGAAKLRALTSASVRRRVALMLDGYVESAPMVLEPIAGGVLWLSSGSTSKASRARADLVAAALGTGELPPLVFEREEAIGE